MRTTQRKVTICILFLSLLISSCGTRQLFVPTATMAATTTNTPVPPTVLPCGCGLPTSIPTVLPTAIPTPSTVAGVLTGLGPQGGRILDLVVDPQTPTTLYAAFFDGGIFKSTDDGGNWRVIDTGLTPSETWALAIDPLTPSTLYAATGHGLFRKRGWRRELALGHTTPRSLWRPGPRRHPRPSNQPAGTDHSLCDNRDKRHFQKHGRRRTLESR